VLPFGARLLRNHIPRFVNVKEGTPPGIQGQHDKILHHYTNPCEWLKTTLEQIPDTKLSELDKLLPGYEV
jgi:hypothetical protein